MFKSGGIAVTKSCDFLLENAFQVSHCVSRLDILVPTSLEQQLDKHWPRLLDEGTLVGTLEHLLSHCLWCIHLIRLFARHHLPNENGHGIDITLLIVRFFVCNLWSHVTKTPSLSCEFVKTVSNFFHVPREFLGETKIKEFDIVTNVKANVLGLNE